MSVQRYRRKPERNDRGDQFAARFDPDQPLDDLREVACMADRCAELATAMFPSGPLLVVRWTRVPDYHPAEVEYVTVEPGQFLAYSTGSDFLYDSDEADWRQFYDLVSES